jgi:hypothetical protein
MESITLIDNQKGEVKTQACAKACSRQSGAKLVLCDQLIDWESSSG